MEPNLQEQYEQIEEVIGEYRSFIHQAFWRAVRPVTYIRILILFLKVFGEKNGDTSRTDRKREIIKRMTEMVYSKDERNSPFYGIGIGPHSLHKLSCFVERKYPDISYEHLLKVHEISDIRIKGGNPAKLFGFVLAGGSLFLKTVPQPVVESLNIDYTNYQITTFWVLVVALAYSSILIAVWYTTRHKHDQVNKLAKEVIEYTAARIKAQSPNKSFQPTAKSGG